MPRGRPGPSAAKPHSKKKAARILSPDEEWAASVADRILADAHPWQRDAISDPARLFTWLVGRGGGKTTAFKGKYIIDMCRIERGRFVFGAPTLGMASELLWEPLKKSCGELGIEAHWQEAPREGGKIVTFERTGSRLKLFGADRQDQIDLLRGQAFDGVGGDEVALWNPQRLANFQEKIIEPRQGERDGWLGFASTPGHILRGPFFNMTRPNAVDKETGKPYHRPFSERNLPEWEDWPGCSSHHWNLGDVAALPNAAQLYPAIFNLWRSALKRKIDKGWSDSNPIWQREYLGRWAADNTTTVFTFDPDKNLWSPAPALTKSDGWASNAVTAISVLQAALAALPKGHTWHFVMADDMGHGDPFACNVFAFAPDDPAQTIWHVFCYERARMYARPIAQLTIGEDSAAPNGCMSADKPGGVYGIIGWPDGAVIDSDKALIDELANVYGIRMEKAEKKPDYKYGAIELVNGDLTDDRIKAIEGSPLHTQLQELQWAETDSGVLKEDPSQPNHSSDCLVYGRKLIARLFESGVVATDRENTTYRDPMGIRSADEALLSPGMDEYEGLPGDRYFAEDENWKPPA